MIQSISKIIDTIYIQNIGINKTDKSYHDYKIRKPENIKSVIVHDRNDGYEVLLIKALKKIVKCQKMNKEDFGRIAEKIKC